jgi:hypothetical protein
MSLAIYTKGSTVGMHITQNDWSGPCVPCLDAPLLRSLRSRLGQHSNARSTQTGI